MGRTVYWMNVSLDGYIEHTPADHTSMESAEAAGWRIDEELHRHFNEQARGLSVLVEGRVVYEMMDPFWPDAAQDESLEPVLQEFGRIWTDLPKVLVSRTRTSAQHNTRIFGGNDALERLAELRETTDGAIGVGGANLATQLLRAGLLDELLLYVHPVLVGSGRPLFDELREPLQCDLLESHDFSNGVVMRRYAVQR